MKKSKSSAKLLNANEILEKAKTVNKKEASSKYINHKKKKNLNRNLNPNVLCIMRKKGSNLTKNSNAVFINSGLSEIKENENNNNSIDDYKNYCDFPSAEKQEKINFINKNKKKLTIANKKNTSSPYLLKNQNNKLTETNLEKSPKAVSRNSSNMSILDYQLDLKKNNNYYFDRKNKINMNKLENNYEIRALNPLMVSNANLNQVLFSNESFENKKHANNKLKASLPRSVSYNNKDLCVNIDKEIYNTILKNIHKNLHKENKQNKQIKSTTEKDHSINSLSEPICGGDQISENSFKLKYEKSISKLLKNEEAENSSSKKIKKLKINASNYVSNINGYAPLVKKTEMKNNQIYNYYEYRDENNKKVVFKTKVLESSELLNKLEEEEQEIICFDSAFNNLNNNYNNDLYVKELKNFQWDNLPAYIVKQEKLAKKQSLGIEPKEKLSFFSVFSNVVKDQIIKKIDSDKMKKAFAIFMVTLMLQLILSRK